MAFPIHIEAWFHVAVGIGEGLALLCIPLVLLRRKEPPTAVAWILVLIFIPYVGLVLFWFFGRDRVRRPARKYRERTGANEARKEAHQGPHQRKTRIPSLFPGISPETHLDAALEAEIATHPESQRGVMRLAARMRQGPLIRGNQVDVMVGADETYRALLNDIESARRSIHLEYYIFDLDPQGERFMTALQAAASRGLDVRLLADAFGSRGLSKRHPSIKSYLAAGGKLTLFFPLSLFRGAWTINLRNHRKIAVIDGRIAYTGGINIGEMFFGWRDVHLRLTGPIVSELQSTFLDDWSFSNPKETSRDDQEFTQTLPTDIGDSETSTHEGHALVQMVDSGPDSPTQAIHRLYFAAIASARTRVFITTPYFVPDKAILMALQTAALRGIDVRLILPSRSNHVVTFHAGRSYYEELLEAGVKIHEYHCGMVHTKTMIVDGRFATVGSANLDVRSFRLNFETIAVLYDIHSVQRIESIFFEDLANTQPVDIVAWRARPFPIRVAEGFGRLCSPLL